MEDKINNINHIGLPFKDDPKQKYLKDIIKEEGDYYIIPKCVSLLPFDEAMLFGYYIDVEPITKHIEINHEDYFQCSTEGFTLKMFQNSNKQQIHRLLDKLINKKLIKKQTLNISGKNMTYIHINYDAYEKLKINYNLQLAYNIQKIIINNINLISQSDKRKRARIFLILQENQIYVYIIKILVGIHQILKDIISGIQLIQQ